MDVWVRSMGPADIPQVRAIEREAFSPGWPSTPYERDLRTPELAGYFVLLLPGQPPPPPPSPPLWEQLRAGLRQRFGQGPSTPKPTEDFIVGYVGLWYTPEEAHITAIAVLEGYRRLGFGELLMITAIQEGERRGCRRVTLEVRVSNKGAQALYEKYGFRYQGVRRGYYTDDGEDAYLMGTDPIGDPAFQELFSARKESYEARHGPPQHLVITDPGSYDG